MSQVSVEPPRPTPNARPRRGAGSMAGGRFRAVVSDPRRVRWAGSICFVLLGWVWALSTPLMGVPDENAHAIRAASIAHGQLRGRPVSVDDVNKTGERTIGVVTVPAAYAALDALPACHRYFDEQPADCAARLTDDTTMVDAATAAGSYPPAYYALVGWPSRLLEPTAALFAMRLFSALLCGVLVGWALGAVAGLGRNRFAVVGVGLAATPMAMFMFGSINPNGLEIASALALWALSIELLRGPTRPSNGQLVRTLIAAVLLTSARPLGLAFTLGIAAVTIVFLGTRPDLRRMLHDRRVWAAAGVLALAGGLAMAWTFKTSTFQTLSGVPHAPVSGRAEAARLSLGLTQFRVRQMIGYFGWLDSPPPGVLVTVWMAGLAVAATVALVVGTMRQRAAVVVLVAATVAFPVVSEMSTAVTLGFIWQGRYTLPLAVGLPIVAAVIVSLRRGPSRVLHSIAVFIAILVGIGQAIGWATMMSRYQAGASHPLTSFLQWPNDWHAPLGNGALTLLAALAVIALTVLLVEAARGAPVADGGEGVEGHPAPASEPPPPESQTGPAPSTATA